MTTDLLFDKLEFPKVLQYISKYSITEKGKQLASNLKPLNRIDHAVLQGQLVEQAKSILLNQTPPPIEYLSDLTEIILKSKIDGVVLDSKKIYEVLKLAVISRNLLQYLKTNFETAPELLNKGSRLFVDKVFEHHIKKIVNENGDIVENASPKLREIRAEINRKKDELIKTVTKLIKKLSDEDIVREDYLTLRDGRIVIPVKAEHKRHIKGFIHSESSTGQTVYIEPAETLEMNNEIISLSFAEKREIERILKELTRLIGNASAELLETLELIGEIDCIFARAHYSVEILGSYPEVNNKMPVYLKDARHPILLKKNGRDATIPLNLKIDLSRIIIITGPNAGGKTVVLKTTGLLALMVKSGIHIPASPDSNFHFYDHILIDIGDEQSIEDDLSTFSSHLSNIGQILKKADSSSLVLLDEIGAGTDPAEGSALAAAVLITLKQKGSTVLATTHHGSLKIIANEIDGFENAAMEFDNELLKPTYNFKQGIPGSSYAFDIARRIGFSEDFLNTAENYLDTDRHKIENFLVEIEKKSQMLSEKLKNTELENIRLSGLTNLYKQNIDNLEQEKKEILKKVKLQGEEFLKDINSRIENVIKDLKEKNASTESILDAKAVVKELKEETTGIIQDEMEDIDAQSSDINLGDFAVIKDTHTKGEIIELSKDGKKAVLASGKIKIQVPIKNLRKVKPEKEKKSEEFVSYHPNTELKYRLDIRGKRPEETELEVLKFVDDAFASNMTRIEILHGKGTGALKKLVNDILSEHEKVKNYYFAPIDVGGDGITIVELI